MNSITKKDMEEFFKRSKDTTVAPLVEDTTTALIYYNLAVKLLCDIANKSYSLDSFTDDVLYMINNPDMEVKDD
jgi:hypothetical protein